MARLYANENFPVPVVEALRGLGHNVLTSLEAGKAGQSVADEEVLRFAIQEQRALLTLNRKHFRRLHEQNPQHAGIILCSFDPDFTEQAARIDELLRATDTLAGQLLRVNRPQK